MRYFIISYKKQPLGESGESCKSDYIFSDACVDCGTGAILANNLKVKAFSNIKKDFFETLDGDFIISKKLYMLIQAKFADFKLERVVGLNNKAIDYYHFSSHITLPKIKSDSTGFVIEGQCQTCKRNGYFKDVEIGDLEKKTPTLIHPYIFKYNKHDIEKFKSNLILNTWECFGLSNKIATCKYIIRYARPLIIVSEKIKDIFESERLKDIEYEQIIIE